MARQPTGQVIEHHGTAGRTFSLRFRANGKRRFVSLGPVTRADAERELRGILTDVERGVWKPPRPAPAPPPEALDPTLHEFTEQWWTEREHELAPKTQCDYHWRLENHLLPFFGGHALREITIAEVDRYKAAKLREGALSAESINKTLVLLAAILEVAEERELIVRNPARGRRRRVRAHKPQRTYLETAEQIEALLSAAGELDTEARPDRRHVPRRALLAVLLFAGLRIGELIELRWRDVDLAAGRLRVGRAKTDAGVRHVRLRPVLRDVLVSLKADQGDASSAAPVFAARSGRPADEHNIRHRVLAGSIERANANLERAGAPPLPAGITPHSMRRTFASLLYALGENPAVVMAEMGHADPGLALRIYAQAMRRDDGEIERLHALVDGVHWAEMGRQSPQQAFTRQLPQGLVR